MLYKPEATLLAKLITVLAKIIIADIVVWNY
jgi:hypothetical protein